MRLTNEHDHQVRLFNWAAANEDRWPELALMFHPPMGGYRRKATAARMKAQGARAGIPDVCLPVARGGFIGLWIEMKYGKNQPTDRQWEWIARLRKAGHFVVVCWDWEDARDVILEYLGHGGQA